MEVEIIIQILQDGGELLVIKMNGLIEQWGSITTVSIDYGTTLTFHVQFSSGTSYYATVEATHLDDYSNYRHAVGNKTASTCVLYVNNANNTTAYWFAKGY